MLAVLGGGGDVHRAVLLGLLHGQVGKVAGDGVVCLAGLADEIQGDHAKLHGAAALKEENLVPLGHTQEPAELFLGFVKNLEEHLGAVAHLHDGHAGAAVVGDLRHSPLEHLQRKHGGTCREVKHAIVCHKKYPFLPFHKET